MEKARSVKEELNGKVFISRQSRHISFEITTIKVFFPTLYFDMACEKLCFTPWNRCKYENWTHEIKKFSTNDIKQLHFDFKEEIFNQLTQFTCLDRK